MGLVWIGGATLLCGAILLQFIRSAKRQTATPQTPTIAREVHFESLSEEELEREFAERCGGKTTFSMSIFDRCNFGFGYHCVMEARSISPALAEKLRALFTETYRVYAKHFTGTMLTARHNRLTHVLLAMQYLGMLSPAEGARWVETYERYTIDPVDMPFAQNWNRVWFFIGMGFDNVNALPAPHALLSPYLASLRDIEMQDCFNEGPGVMRNKFIMMRSFFNQALTSEERAALETWENPREEKLMRKDLGDMRRFYTHLLAIPQ